MGSQEPCSSRQVDEAISNVPIVHDKSGTDSLKTLKEIKTELVKKAVPYSGCRENPVQILCQSVEKRAVGTCLRRRRWHLRL